jgi:hypothetical protein
MSADVLQKLTDVEQAHLQRVGAAFAIMFPQPALASPDGDITVGVQSLQGVLAKQQDGDKLDMTWMTQGTVY